MQRPLLAVPEPLRLPVWNLWILQRHLVADPLSISGAIATDLSHGLNEEDAAAVIDALTHPEERAKYKFAADLMAELSRRTALAIAWRRKEREQEERRREMEGGPPQPSLAEMLAQKLAAGMAP
jgi:hypothetical protein